MLVLIKGVTVVNADGVEEGVDILIDGECISRVEANISSSSDFDGTKVDRIIDGSKLVATPGGVDSHVHFHYPQGKAGVVSCDDFYTGSAAAAAGGTTCFIDFIEAKPAQSFMDAMEKRVDDANRNSVIDFSFHMSLNLADEEHFEEIRNVVEAGIPSFKIYTCYDGIRLEVADIYRGMQFLRKYGGMALIHCEDDVMLKNHMKRALDDGMMISPLPATIHEFLHPALAETAAIHQMACFAEECGIDLHIVHVSAKSSVDVLERLRSSRWTGERLLTAEVCIQHLIHTDELLSRPNAYNYIMSPPLRTKEDQDRLWDGLTSGLLDFVITDHCPFTVAQRLGKSVLPPFVRDPHDPLKPLEECEKNETKQWLEDPKLQGVMTPGGVPGVENRVALLHESGVLQRKKMSLPEWVRVSSTAAARRFGLYPKKGIIAPGSDADIVLWDLESLRSISWKTSLHNCEYSLYEGHECHATPRFVLARGNVLVEDGKFVGNRGFGRFLRRNAIAYKK
eukprot:TRINITY_DN558_c0_g1_i3.p1 TRINITY_DN558_c0_g1~~TRINITY_DN558_c0_g1_i3.p1  ORF type:complete len:509 (+),score=140.01 TRINITY_DN558_c0_g1_i3:40-1566(+)